MAEEKSSENLCQGVGSWIVSTAHAFRRALECELSQEGITFRQWEVLVWLHSDGEQPQNELAEKMGIETQTLGGILSRMERDGWLTRESCPEDRRRKMIRPSDQAEKILEGMHACCDRVRIQAIQGISESHLEKLNRTCERIRKNLDHECPGLANTYHKQSEEETSLQLDETLPPSSKGTIASHTNSNLK